MTQVGEGPPRQPSTRPGRPGGEAVDQVVHTGGNGPTAGGTGWRG